MEPSPWSWDPAPGVVVALALIALAYAVTVRTYATSRVRIASFAAGLALAAAVLVTPVETIAIHYLLSAHLFQNVALAEWVPALLVLGVGRPLAEALGTSPVFRALTNPFVALPLWLATYAAWHVPAAYDAALRNHALLHLEHACYLATGFLLWWPVLQDAPHRLAYGLRATYMFAAFLLASPLGLLLTLLPEPIYSFYEAAPRPWDISPLADQQIAGVIMSASEAVVFFAAFSFFVSRFFTEEA